MHRSSLLALCLILGFARASPAQAGVVQVWDSFEGSPWTRMDSGGDGDGVAGFDINGGVAYTGANNGWLHVGNGWAAHRLAVNLDGGFSGKKWNCSAAVRMNVLGAGAVAGLQVWDPNGWHIIAEHYPWINGNGSGYHLVAIHNLDLTRFQGNIYLQVIYGDNRPTPQFIRVDDLVLQCYY